MINGKISNLILSRLKKDDIVIDIGGGRYPWFRANYILDKRAFDKRVGKTDIDEKVGGEEHFSRETWVSRDFYELPWPFEDKFFDFSLCTDTLEDLRDPIAICKEIQRVSKAGYISTPTRAAESKIGVSEHSKSNKLQGYFHHRWFVEIIDAKLVFKMKTPLLYQNRRWLIDEIGQSALNYFWEDSFDYEEQYLAGHKEALKDFESFYYKHKKWLALIKTDRFDGLYQHNHWPKSWGSQPDFLEMDNYIGNGGNRMIKGFVNRFFRS
ncbi:methyltransferase domain-containing protein [Patescibacteria group bacterium]|nr:methyltransferase domain-containing protein [Patescibacteria group bacterium]